MMFGEELLMIAKLIGVAGIGCLVVGASLFAPAAGWITAGAGLLFVAIDGRR